MDLNVHLKSQMEEWQNAGLLRQLIETESPQGSVIKRNGCDVINFCSNDYLGLAFHPALREAAARAAQDWGSGAGAARLICGNTSLHRQLEEKLASFKGAEAALCFSSGYATALGVIPALVGKGDVVILDKLSHACLIDAARLSGATIRVFPHNNIEVLEGLLKKTAGNGKQLIVTESIFSMDGDRAPLKQMVELKERYGAWLMVDEAHATGLFGERLSGCIEAEGGSNQVEIQMGTLSKALGSSGGYVCGSRLLIDFLIQKARSFMFSTAPVPASVASASAAIDLLRQDEGKKRVVTLWKNVNLFSKLSGLKSESPIFPVIIGDETQAMRKAADLLKIGMWCGAIRYPTVPRKRARLRITFTAAHEIQQVETVANALESYE